MNKPILTKNQVKIIKKTEAILKCRFIKYDFPQQGMDSTVIFVTDEKQNEYVVKIGNNSFIDFKAYEIIRKNNINIPVPTVISYFICDGKEVIVLEKIKFPLLESIDKKYLPLYIPSMISTQKELHKVKLNKAGNFGSNNNETWKSFFQRIFTAENENIDWHAVCSSNSLDGNLIQRSIEKLLHWTEKIDFLKNNYSFLHTDYNQRNLFVNPETHKIAGIIDWSESCFGDPIYDFARIRMFIWHFDLEKMCLGDYYTLMSYSSFDKELEELYWISRIIEYLAWYSEKLNDFNLRRIKLHQDFLRNYTWEY